MADSNDDDDFMKSLDDFVGDSDGNTTNQEYNEVDLVSFFESETTRNEVESTNDDAETTVVSNEESKKEKKLAEFDKNYFKPPSLLTETNARFKDQTSTTKLDDSSIVIASPSKALDGLDCSVLEPDEEEEELYQNVSLEEYYFGTYDESLLDDDDDNEGDDTITVSIQL